MADWEAIERAVGDAVLDPSRWETALDAISHAAGPDGAKILARVFGFAATRAAVETLQVSGVAVAMFNNAGEVIDLNQRARNLLGSGIHLINQRLVAENAEATEELDRALKVAISSEDFTWAPPVRLPRPDRAPLVAYPLRLSYMAANPFVRCRALVILADPEERSRPLEEALCSTFNLTVAEARLAARLAAGEPLESASQSLGIAVGTARNQLKSIFAKTGARRQSELVATLLNMLPQFFGTV